MTVAHPSSARSSLRWLLIILAIAAIGLLVWWLWPAPQETPQRPGGRPGFGAFGGPVPVRVAKVEQGDSNIDQFTETEDLVIYALDTISPFDVKFISQHMANRDEHQIERRLTDQTFRKKSFSFQKVPYLMFELVFVSESNDRSSSLMILTQRKLIQLKCKNTWCQYGPGIETIEMNYNPRTRFGIDTGALCEFIITNIPNMHMPYLRRNVREIEAFMEESGIHFRSANRKVDLKQILNRVQPEITMESLRMEGMPLIKIDEAGVLHLKEEHEEMLVKIVKSVGRNHWEEVTKLLTNFVAAGAWGSSEPGPS